MREFADEWDEDGDDRWIVCDVCNQPYHLQCSGIQYTLFWSTGLSSWMKLILNVRCVKEF